MIPTRTFRCNNTFLTTTSLFYFQPRNQPFQNSTNKFKKRERVVVIYNWMEIQQLDEFLDEQSLKCRQGIPQKEGLSIK